MAGIPGSIYRKLDPILPFDRYLDPRLGMLGGQNMPQTPMGGVLGLPDAGGGRTPMFAPGAAAPERVAGIPAIPELAGGPRRAGVDPSMGFGPIPQMRQPEPAMPQRPRRATTEAPRATDGPWKPSALDMLWGVAAGYSPGQARRALEQQHAADLGAGIAAERAAEEDAIARRVFADDERGYLAWRANREKAGEALSSGLEDYTLAPGGVRGRAGQTLQRAPFAPIEGSPGTRIIDPTTREIIADVPYKPEVVKSSPEESVSVVTPGAPGGAGGQSVGQRNNNPGNLEDGPFARSQPGYVGSDGRFARFETPEAGAAAQERLLASTYIGRGQNTIQSIIEGVPGDGGRRVHGYSPRQADGGDNTDEQVNNYIAYVASRAGIRPGDPIPEGKVAAVAAAMREFETGDRSGAVPSLTTLRQGTPKQTGFRPITQEERRTWGIPEGIPAGINVETGQPQILTGAASALPKPPPRLVVQGYGGNKTAIDMIDRALALLKARKNKGAIGPQRAFGDFINQWADPEGIAARAAIADISGMTMHDRSGAAVPKREMDRLQPYLPQIADRYEAAVTKLKGLRDRLELTNQQMQYDYPGLGEPGAGLAGGSDVADQIADGEVPTERGAAPPSRRAPATAGAPRAGRAADPFPGVKDGDFVRQGGKRYQRRGNQMVEVR